MLIEKFSRFTFLDLSSELMHLFNYFYPYSENLERKARLGKMSFYNNLLIAFSTLFIFFPCQFSARNNSLYQPPGEFYCSITHGNCFMPTTLLTGF